MGRGYMEQGIENLRKLLQSEVSPILVLGINPKKRFKQVVLDDPRFRFLDADMSRIDLGIVDSVQAVVICNLNAGNHTKSENIRDRAKQQKKEVVYIRRYQVLHRIYRELYPAKPKAEPKPVAARKEESMPAPVPRPVLVEKPEVVPVPVLELKPKEEIVEKVAKPRNPKQLSDDEKGVVLGELLELTESESGSVSKQALAKFLQRRGLEPVSFRKWLVVGGWLLGVKCVDKIGSYRSTDKLKATAVVKPPELSAHERLAQLMQEVAEVKSKAIAEYRAQAKILKGEEQDILDQATAKRHLRDELERKIEELSK